LVAAGLFAATESAILKLEWEKADPVIPQQSTHRRCGPTSTWMMPLQ
jgi:hypothetical protein